jgi:fatty acid metabolism transcriptional regulator FadR
MPKNVFPLKSIARSRLHEDIVIYFQQQIMSGAIAPGTKLPPEHEMAKSLQVNRSTLREALCKLENFELIEIRHGDGVYVKNYLDSSSLNLIKATVSMEGGNDTLLNMMEVRLEIVPLIAAKAAERRTEADLAELKQVMENLELDHAERDFKVHQMIARASHNMVYIIALNFFNRIHLESGYLYYEDQRNIQHSQKFYREIYAAIRDREPKAAERIMRDVLLYADTYVKNLLAAEHD